MNEERMDMVLDEAWSGTEEAPAEDRTGEFETEEGGAGADNGRPAPQQAGARPVAVSEQGRAAAAPTNRTTPKDGKGHPLMEQIQANARKRDMTRFMKSFPGVKAEDIPQQVWVQVSQGVPMISAYAMHENAQLKAQLAAERQHRANLRRTPGGLGSHSGPELDELDRMWAEDD